MWNVKRRVWSDVDVGLAKDMVTGGDHAAFRRWRSWRRFGRGAVGLF